MRIRVDLQGPPNLFVPFNYNHIIASIIYNQIYDLDLAAELHLKHGFKFFTFSQLMIHRRRQVKGGFLSDGYLHFFISSPDETLVNNLIRGFYKRPDISFQGQHLQVKDVKLIPKPRFKEHMHLKTLSPIIVRTRRNNKIWDLGPDDKLFYDGLKRNLLKKYKEYNGTEDVKEDINIELDLNRTRRRRIAITKDDKKTFNRCYMAELDIEADLNLIKFAYDVGLGERNSMGFGMMMAV
ncbi:MAG: CRISPR-associated endoribonuclease Cas6 [Methanobacterium sp. PtaU1.Bin097]|nr:MAG: CRISPR-associated endoribonuclease Cas6 [Methanobacterium sp. PtaU1.Bin097]